MPLPASQLPDNPDFPLLKADTLEIPVSDQPVDATGSRPRGSQGTFMVRRIQIYVSGDQEDRVDNVFAARWEGDLLIMDGCPFGSLCTIYLAASSSTFRLVGDQLVGQLPPGSPYLPVTFERVFPNP
jgi:hypothetical protein